MPAYVRTGHSRLTASRTGRSRRCASQPERGPPAFALLNQQAIAGLMLESISPRVVRKVSTSTPTKPDGSRVGAPSPTSANCGCAT